MEGGQKTVASIQGPDLVTLEKNQDVAEELLITIWDLAQPKVARNWIIRFVVRGPTRRRSVPARLPPRSRSCSACPATGNPRGIRAEERRAARWRWRTCSTLNGRNRLPSSCPGKARRSSCGAEGMQHDYE